MDQSTHQAPKHYVVTKTWHDDRHIVQLGGPILMDSLRNDREIVGWDEEELEQRPVYVIRAKPINGDWTELHYFDKDTGIRLRYVELDSKSAEFHRVALSEVETGVAFEPDHFTL